MNARPASFRRSIQATRTITTLAALVAAPSMLMAQPAPFAATDVATPTNVPAWTDTIANRFPGCEAHRDGDVAPAVVVVDSGADAHRMSTDGAYALNTDDERANNVWVVGTCA